MLIRFRLIPAIFVVVILSLEGAQWYFMPNFGGDVRGVEWHHVWESLDYATYGDEEIRCRKAELNVTNYYPRLDWANPGCQSKNQFGPNP